MDEVELFVAALVTIHHIVLSCIKTRAGFHQFIISTKMCLHLHLAVWRWVQMWPQWVSYTLLVGKHTMQAGYTI